jgi:hypothetical protein
MSGANASAMVRPLLRMIVAVFVAAGATGAARARDVVAFSAYLS